MSTIPDVVPSVSSTSQLLQLYSTDGTKVSETALPFGTGQLAMGPDGILWLSGGANVVGYSLHSKPPIVVRTISLPGASLSRHAISHDGHHWISDSSMMVIHEFDAFGALIRSIPWGTYPTPGGLAIGPSAQTPAGFYVWWTNWDNNSALAQLVRFDPATGMIQSINLTNRRLPGLAIAPTGEIVLPVEVGGSNAIDELRLYTENFTLIKTSPTTGWVGTFIWSAIVHPSGRIYCTAADGNGTSNNPAVLFEFDQAGNFVCGLSIANGHTNANPRGITIDGTGSIWVALPGSSELHLNPATGNCPAGTFLSVPASPSNLGDPTGYLQAFIVRPDDDFDFDGVPNRAELVAGTNPFRP